LSGKSVLRFIKPFSGLRGVFSLIAAVRRRKT
jgi:hypothetical protein